MSCKLIRRGAPALLLALALAAPAAAAEPTVLAGQVAQVHDGDTPTVWLRTGPHAGDLARVRLSCADTPELKVKGRWGDQPRGQEAQALAERLIAGKRVHLVLTGGISHDRIVAQVVLPDGRDLGLTLMQAGLAWADLRYCQVRRDRAYLDALDEASRAGLGIWADPEPFAPWTWRKERMGR